MDYVIHEKDSSPPRFLDGYNGRANWQWSLIPHTAWGFPTRSAAEHKGKYVAGTSPSVPCVLSRAEAQQLAKKHWGAKSKEELGRIIAAHVMIDSQRPTT